MGFIDDLKTGFHRLDLQPHKTVNQIIHRKVFTLDDGKAWTCPCTPSVLVQAVVLAISLTRNSCGLLLLWIHICLHDVGIAVICVNCIDYLSLCWLILVVQVSRDTNLLSFRLIDNDSAASLANPLASSHDGYVVLTIVVKPEKETAGCTTNPTISWKIACTPWFSYPHYQPTSHLPSRPIFAPCSTHWPCIPLILHHSYLSSTKRVCLLTSLSAWSCRDLSERQTEYHWFVEQSMSHLCCAGAQYWGSGSGRRPQGASPYFCPG